MLRRSILLVLVTWTAGKVGFGQEAQEITANPEATAAKVLEDTKESHRASPPGMVLIRSGEFTMGTDNPSRFPNERPAHRVRVEGFWIDIHDVTNAEFAKFVEVTGYLTTAEKKPDWEELKNELPPGTPKPDDNGEEIVAVRWHEFRLYPKQFVGSAMNMQGLSGHREEGNGFPAIFNIEADPREEVNILATHGWVINQYLRLIGEYQKTLVKYPNPKAANLTEFGK